MLCQCAYHLPADIMFSYFATLFVHRGRTIICVWIEMFTTPSISGHRVVQLLKNMGKLIHLATLLISEEICKSLGRTHDRGHERLEEGELAFERFVLHFEQLHFGLQIKCFLS
jgi:hypothetical protein